LKTTRYFEEQVLRKRPYLRREWCREVLAAHSGARRRRMVVFVRGAELLLLEKAGLDFFES
jgi:hypothetical protein